MNDFEATDDECVFPFWDWPKHPRGSCVPLHGDVPKCADDPTNNDLTSKVTLCSQHARG